jgi:hypothetical protein
VWAFFPLADEEYDVLLPFLRERFDRGEKAFHIVDPESRTAPVRGLENVGIPVDTAKERRQFQLHNIEWALGDRLGVDDLEEYETRLNYVLPRYRDPVV